VEAWNMGFRSVPTIVVEDENGLPEAQPSSNKHSPRGWRRDRIITEPDVAALEEFLRLNGLV
jgi:hypothetical protein